MELLDSRKQETDLLILRALITLCAAAITAGLVLTTLAIIGPKHVAVEPLPLPKLDKNLIGQGPLSLQQPSMLSNILFVGASTRPDSPLQMTFADRSSGKSWTVKVSEEITLQETSFIPHSLENGVAICTLADGREVRLAQSTYFIEQLSEKPYFKTLQEGAMWPPDVFLVGWGGDEMRELTKKTKVCVGSALFFLKTGDCLAWNGDRWMQGSVKGAPLAQLVRTGQAAEFRVWDESGFTVEKVKLGLKGGGEFRFDLAAHLSAPRPRSKMEVSCLLGKRRVVIREGDWWIRTQERWKQVRTAADFEAVLYHKMVGELCLFETVEILANKVVIRGHAFDNMRGAVLPVTWTAPLTKKRNT